MHALPLALMAFLMYLTGATWQGLNLAGRVPPKPSLVRSCGLLGLLFQLPLATSLLSQGNSFFPDLPTSIVLASGVAVATLLAVSLFKPVLSISAFLFPIAGLSLLLAAGIPNHEHSTNSAVGMTPDIALHALSSAMAFAVLGIAAIQAVLLGFQNHALRHHRLSGLAKSLPPLTTMERVLFELIWTSLILLTLSIASGFMFFDNMFAQHLAHKTALSIIAWCILACLLAGHHWLGWRGMRAVRWTLIGYVVLLLAYFGSKFVLEVLLSHG
ncbi:cytochrome C assembly family protein [Halomonas halocynthiae]|uniref:cytochrome C assembly family protein n=1 Tax=Halomonas halocynthiae TaxID=176290 RepID=UPI00041FEE4D|nr:cytochrome c biogenesis protein CcsA [Halomonas halocynthiae]